MTEKPKCLKIQIVVSTKKKVCKYNRNKMIVFQQYSVNGVKGIIFEIDIQLLS